MSVRVRRTNHPQKNDTVDDIDASASIEAKVDRFPHGRLDVWVPSHPRYQVYRDGFGKLPRPLKPTLLLQAPREMAMSYGDWLHIKNEIDRLFNIAKGFEPDFDDARPDLDDILELEIIDLDGPLSTEKNNE